MWELGTELLITESKTLFLDCTKAMTELSWSNALEFEQTVKMTVEWYKNEESLTPEALMQKQLPFEAAPEAVEFTEELLEFEKPKLVIPGKPIKLPTRENKGASFHEKKAKNKKVNVRYDHKKAMQEKYGKPKKAKGK
jgi:hypothetical protein